MQPRTVAIIRGGPSSRFADSLKTGKAVASALSARGHRIVDIVVDQNGVWLRNGVGVSPRQAAHGADVAWNAAHGEFGEDGQVQRLLRQIGLPHTGSGAVGSALSLSKHHAREALRQSNVRLPVGREIAPPENGDVLEVARELFQVAPMPAIVKPASGGFSRGIRVVSTIPELADALASIFAAGEKAVIEEHLRGREATVGVLEGFRGENLYCFPIAEVCLPKGAQFLSAEMKQAGVPLVCPGRFSKEERATIYDAARRAHEALGLKHLSRVDLIVHPKRGVYVLEVNASPELWPGERMPAGFAAVGADLGQVAEHIVETALSGR